MVQVLTKTAGVKAVGTLPQVTHVERGGEHGREPGGEVDQSPWHGGTLEWTADHGFDLGVKLFACYRVAIKMDGVGADKLAALLSKMDKGLRQIWQIGP